MKKSLIALILVFSGCTTVEFVRKDLTPKKQAVLRYSPPSSEKSEAKYRAKLNEQATSFCGGPYTVLKEYEALQDSGRSTGVGTGVGLGFGGILIGGSSQQQEMYHFVEIACGS
jgi:hypothetical protein